MPSLDFLEDPTEKQIDQIADLYQKAGWWDEASDNPEQIAKIIKGSHCFCICTDNEIVIAMGRAISDGVSDAYIQDVTVDKKQRGQGIGTRIVEKLVARLQRDGLAWIGLIAERGTSRFYEPMGFKTMPDSTPMKRTPS